MSREHCPPVQAGEDKLGPEVCPYVPPRQVLSSVAELGTNNRQGGAGNA